MFTGVLALRAPPLRMSSSDAWEFGRGLSGYLWRAAAPRAKLLLSAWPRGIPRALVWTHYNRLGPKLNLAGFELYAFHLYGHGLSTVACGEEDMRKAKADHRAARSAYEPVAFSGMGQSRRRYRDGGSSVAAERRTKTLRAWC